MMSPIERDEEREERIHNEAIVDVYNVEEQAIAELSDSLGWVYLGQEGREINAILAGASSEYAP